MDEDVAQCNDLGPRNLGMTISQRLRNSAGRLSDHLQVVNDPDLKHLVTQENFEADRGSSDDLTNGIDDVV
jgi:hypothetical protein